MEFEVPVILKCQTPTAWLNNASENLSTLLIDHALCEKKAALSAISLLYSYGKYPLILDNMAKLAREELKHFDMVIAIMKNRNIQYKPIIPSKYAKSLHKLVAKDGDERFVDQLTLAAFIEARSYERFLALFPILDSELSIFYKRLCYSERRHYYLYLDIIKEYFPSKLEEKIALFAEHEAQLITSKDDTFRMHSGIPI